MRIESYAINMSSSHSYSEVKTSEEKLRYWSENNKVDLERKGSLAALSKSSLDSLQLSKEALNLQEKNLDAEKTSSAAETTNADGIQLTIPEEDKQKIKMIEEFITKLTGKKFKIQVFDKLVIKENDEQLLYKLKMLQNSNVNSSQSSQPQPQRQGWGLEYNFHSSYEESEKMIFSTNGIVKTNDGRNINFSLELNMDRSFVSHTNLNIKAGDAAIDPLVINYSGKNLNLTDKKISFDINLDGNKENISFTSAGSGFLAIDANKDGFINDGNELFGPSTGNGFQELKSHDSDNNNWIDENDAIFEKLVIWTKDDNGNDKLFALGEVGIGAIYVGNIGTEFSIKNTENETLGSINSSSIFLRENGSAGTIQHIDLSV